MKTLELRLVDENKVQRETYAATMNMLLANTGVVVHPMEPLPMKEDYISLLTEGAVVGLILDQKLEDGGFSYSGSELASFLRGIDSKLPIFILTNYKNDENEREELEDSEKDVEAICAKKDITNIDSHEAQVIKARLLRRLNVFVDVRNEQQQRFHDLLVKSLSEPLTEDELAEMGLLEKERLLSVQAAELRETPSLESLLDELRKCVGEDVEEK